jgi:hypothetical protein
MAIYGYARVSTDDQDLSIQQATLAAAGATIIRAEKKTGSSRSGRSELELLLEFLRAGDTLVITRIDRLARSMKDLQDIGLVTVWFRSLVFHYATLASKAKGLMPPRYEWRRRGL